MCFRLRDFFINALGRDLLYAFLFNDQRKRYLAIDRDEIFTSDVCKIINGETFTTNER